MNVHVFVVPSMASQVILVVKDTMHCSYMAKSQDLAHV